MKRIEVNGTKRDIAIVIIPRWMTYTEVITFLEGLGLQEGTSEDLRAYHAEYPQELRYRWTTAIGDSKDGKSLAFDALSSDEDGKFVNTNTEQQYLQGCSFIAILPNRRMEDPLEQYRPVIMEKKSFEIDGVIKKGSVIPFSRWGGRQEIDILLAEIGCNLQVGNLEEVKAYFTQHPEDLERKWESRGKEDPYSFRHKEGFDDFFTSEDRQNTSNRWWCGTLLILPE